MANFCLPELMFCFNVSIRLVSVEIIAHTVIILLIPLLSNLFVNSFWCLLFFYTRNFAHFFNEFVSSHKNKENLLFYIVMIKLHVYYFFKKSSFSKKFSNESYQICSFGNQNWMFLRTPKKYESRVAYLDNLTYSSYLLHFTLRFLAAVIYNKIER